MSTEKLTRSQQAKINGTKSRGPKTEAGRMKIADAHTTHGLYRTTASVLSIESAEAFNHLRDAAFAQYRPRTIFEAQLVEEIVDCSWRINRLLAAATAIGNQAIRDFRRSTPGRVTQPEAVAHAEVGTDKQQLIQRRVAALMRTRKALIGELLTAKKLFFAGDSQEPLKTEELPRGDSELDSPNGTFDSQLGEFDSQ
jgi:hypothetical protein